MDRDGGDENREEQHGGIPRGDVSFAVEIKEAIKRCGCVLGNEVQCDEHEGEAKLGEKELVNESSHGGGDY